MESKASILVREKIRVLIVDDEPVVLSALRLASKKRQWQIQAVSSAEEALEALLKNAFDIVIVDKNLPEMTGVELIGEIRKTNDKMGIIMITGFASIESAIETLHLGIDSYIEKPFNNIYDVVNRVEDVAIARRSKRKGGDKAAATMHFRKAFEALNNIKKTSEKLKIIVASPTDSDREWVVKLFGNSSKVVTATSCAEASELARKEAPELLFVDVSGQTPSVLKHLNEIITSAPRAGLIVLTAKKPPLSILAPFVELGARVILEKPLNTATFRSKLEFVAREVKCYANPTRIDTELSANLHMSVEDEPDGLGTEIGDVTVLADTPKQTQSQLIHTEKMAAFGQLGAGITHEVKNSMTGIIGFAQIGQETENEEARELFKMIETQGVRCKNILINYLKFARNEITDVAEMDLNTVTKDAAKIFSHSLGMKKVRVKFDLAKNLPIVLGNPNMVQQVLLNLAINVQHVMPDGGQVNIATSRSEEGHAVITFSDDGPGMPDHIKKQVFDPFFTTKAAGEGTGLGLAVSFDIIRDHGGTISVESELGAGTTFIIQLPAAGGN